MPRPRRSTSRQPSKLAPGPSDHSVQGFTPFIKTTGMSSHIALGRRVFVDVYSQECPAQPEAWIAAFASSHK
jgi:hypothetical protein